MKVFLAVFICRVLYFIGKRLGKGSSLPGKVALKVFPDVLGRLRLPETVIAVTGSNGKTTTTELIVHVLEACGRSVGWNLEGSNQTEGIATLLLRIASFGGKIKRDAIVMECDERYARKIFEKVRPSVLLVTNLCRDQLTRNGHPEFVEDCIRAAITAAGEGTLLVLNADDPYVTALSAEAKETQENRPRALWFGVKTQALSDKAEEPSPCFAGIYDDGAFCPVCKARMVYDYRITGHYGCYNCKTCGLKRSEPDVEAVMQEGQENRPLVFGDGLSMRALKPGITNTYNFCAAVAGAAAVGISEGDCVSALDNYELKSGRVLELTVGKRSGLLLLSKHENSFAYDTSLSWIVSQNKPCTVIVLVNTISRKYYTSETSWLWDIDFDILSDDNVKKIVLAGRYINELAARFVMSAVNPDKIGYVTDLSDLRKYVEGSTVGDVYAVTCFADKVKLLRALESN